MLLIIYNNHQIAWCLVLRRLWAILPRKLMSTSSTHRAGVILHKKPPLGVLDDTNKEDNGKYASFGGTKDGNIENQVPANLKRKVKASRDP
jgi:hypothetical protein